MTFEQSPYASPLRKVVHAEALLKSIRDDPMGFHGLDRAELVAAELSLDETITTATLLLKILTGEK